jgi:hypothetical protein
MTMVAILLNLAMVVPAALVLVAVAVLMPRLSREVADEEGRADWRGPFRPRLQRTAASIATATNSSAR